MTKRTLLKRIPSDNLGKSEREVLKDLQQIDDIVITKAKKGDAVGIIDVEGYIKEVNKQLTTSNCQKLNTELPKFHNKKN